MLSALSRAIAQLADPRLRRVLWKAVGGALAVYVLLFVGIGWLLAETALLEGWAETLIDVLGGLAAVVLSLILFPATVSVILGLFLEEAAAAVEARHYPDLGPARRQSVGEAVATTLRFAAVTVAFNLLVLPLYLIPGVNLAIFYALNGYLLGREYFELVSFRRIAPQDARMLRRKYAGRVWLAGAIVTLFLALPVVNLVAPVVATAFMVHMFESLRRRSVTI